jgi:hypothetical protein
MDTLAAVGLVGSIVHFVDFARKLLSGTLTLYSAENVVMETLIEEIRVRAEKIRSPEGSHGLFMGDSMLRTISDQCIEVSDELLSVLRGLNVDGDHEVWESFYQTLTHQWETNDIKQLQGKLDRIKDQLDTRLISRQRPDLDEALQRLAIQNKNMSLERTQDIRHLKKDVDDTFLQLQQNIKDEDAKTTAWLQLSAMAQKGNEYATEQLILEILRFDTIEDRYVTVQEAHSKTFGWIFEEHTSSGAAAHSVSNPGRPSTRFEEWLTSSERSFYWVSGKPGSGKSTLMKYLCKHPQTLSALVAWSGDFKLITANFFFWSIAKNPLQKSQEGLLRSMLYQILRGCPELIQLAFPDQWLSFRSGSATKALYPFNSLTIPGLLAAFGRIWNTFAKLSVKFCFFIDGLDEYDGRPSQIIELLRLFKFSPNVKLCVSSRPWNDFETAFGLHNTWKLYVHDLTTEDIRSYVHDLLERNEYFQELKEEDARYLDLIQDIVSAAQGVFLWVSLVVQSLLDGITNADRIVDLQRRLKDLPTDLNEYFERILFNIDKFYRQQTAWVCLLTLQSNEHLPLMLYWIIDQENVSVSMDIQPMSMKRAEFRLRQMKRRVNALSKGLLEIFEAHDVFVVGEPGTFIFSNSTFLAPNCPRLPSDTSYAQLSQKMGRRLLRC